MIKLSPSALNLYRNCPRCFWLEKVRNIKRPRGIYPSLPGGMDRVIKSFFDEYRKKKILPDELSGPDFQGVFLFDDQEQLDQWRDWRTGLEYRDSEGAILFGALDDLLVKEGFYIPFDYKTKGSITSETDAVKYYQMQLDCYALMLDANGFKSASYGFLLYFSPKKVLPRKLVEFEMQPIKIAIDINRATEIFREAHKCLAGPMPSSGDNCEYCQWLKNFI
jgi:CRISPR/Cas system-associated exonuclease Cas4 (RecB family)